MLGRMATARFGVIMGMVISCVLIIALVCAVCLRPTNNSNLNISTDTPGSDLGVVDETYTPSKNAEQKPYPSTGEQQGTISVESFSGYTMLTATPITSETGASYVFGYWQDAKGTKVAGDNTIKVKTYTGTEYIPIFIQEYNSQHQDTNLVHRVNDLSSSISSHITEANGYGAGQIFILNDDIDYNSTNFTPLGTSISSTTPTPFAGIIDGAGHKLLNFMASAQGASSYAQTYFGGIVCHLKGGVIKNLTIESGEITATNSQEVGAFAGRVQDGLISQCVNRAKVTNTASSGMAGGMAGAVVQGSNISNGYNGGYSSAMYYNKNYGSIVANFVGAIVYQNQNCAVSNGDGTTTEYPSCYLIKNVNLGSYQTTS